MAESWGTVWRRWRYAALYVLIAGSYIVLSSVLAEAPGPAGAKQAHIELAKGLVFVIFSAGLAQCLIFGRAAGLDRARQELNAHLAAPGASHVSAITTGAIAHEMKNVLMAAMLSADLLSGSRTEVCGSDLEEAERDLRDALNRLNVLSRELMSLVRRDLDDAHATFDLSASARTAIKLLAPAGSPARAWIELDAPTPCLVKGSLRQMELSIVNLLANAIEATQLKGKIRLSVRKKGNMGELEVADEGPGLSEHAKAHLFQPCSSSKATGSGLGLSLSRQIARLCDGDLELVSTSSRGTVFELSLPLSSQNSTAQEPRRAQPLSAPAADH